MGNLFHSVTLDMEKCKGCTTCMKQCPTEAIRVRNGKAKIIKERCIDCGQCIRVCPHRAKRAVCDPFEKLKEYAYTVALPAPSLYGQFHNMDDIGILLTGLTRIGFDDVYEVASGAEVMSDLTRQHMKQKGKLPRPAISSACPACVRLIKKRFPNLVNNVIAHAAPVELSAMLARKQAVEKTALKESDIGVFFISPCPAKVTAAKNPVGLSAPVMDGAFSMAEVYKKLLGEMKNVTEITKTPQSGLIGIGWAVTGGESTSLLTEQYLAVDGIDNVIKILEDIEDDRIPEASFIELNACTQGCVGGCLTVENPYVAKTRIRRLMKYMPVSKNKADQLDEGMAGGLSWEQSLEYNPVWGYDDDMDQAIEKMQEIQKLIETLPGLDCGSCGTPSCRALAEDVIAGFASEEDCIFRMRERMQVMTGSADADAYLPPPFRKLSEEEEETDSDRF